MLLGLGRCLEGVLTGSLDQVVVFQVAWEGDVVWIWMKWLWQQAMQVVLEGCYLALCVLCTLHGTQDKPPQRPAGQAASGIRARQARAVAITQPTLARCMQLPICSKLYSPRHGSKPTCA